MRLRSFAVLTALFLATLPMMATTIYTYTGNPFTAACCGTYTTSHFISGSFTVASPLGNNLSRAIISPITYSFSDGFDTITNATATFSFFALSTGVNGNIEHWDISLGNFFIGSISSGTIDTNDGSPQQASRYNDAGYSYGIGGGFGINLTDPGSWTSANASPVPEPSMLVLLGTGVLSMVGVSRLRFARP